MLSERDVLRGGTTGPDGSRERDTDIRTRLDALRRGPGRGPLERIRRAEKNFRRELDVPTAARASDSPLATGALLAFAYPDRIGKRRAGDAPRYALANGRGASFGNPESIAREEFIVALELDDRDRDARILLAAPLARADLLSEFETQLVQRDEVTWDARAEAVIARRTLRLDELVVDDKPLPDIPQHAAAAAFAEGLRSLGASALPWDDDSRDFAARSEFVRALERSDLADWPDFSAGALLATPLARAVPGRGHAPLAPVTHLADGSVALATEPRAATPARRARADTHRVTDGHAGEDRLPRRQRAVRIDADAGGLRAREHAEDWRRRGARHVQVAVARAAAAAGHARPRQLLEERVRRRAQGHARPLSTALLAREPASCGTD